MNKAECKFHETYLATLFYPVTPLSGQHTWMSWEGYRSRYSDWLRAGRSEDRIPVGGEIFRTCPDRPWGPSRLLHNGYRVFPGGEEWPGRDADLSPLLVQWSRKSRAIPLLPLWTVRLYGVSVPVQGCTLPLAYTWMSLRKLSEWQMHTDDTNSL